MNELVRRFLEDNDTSIYRLAKMLNEKYGRSGSVSNLLNKLSRGSFKGSELMDIAELFGYELSCTKKQAIEGASDNSKSK